MPTASTYAPLCFRGVWGVPLSLPFGGVGVLSGFLLAGPEHRGLRDTAAPQIPVFMIPQGYSLGWKIGHQADGSGSITYGLHVSLRLLSTFVL